MGLVRGRGPRGEGAALEQYVNDRPYAASSFLSVALGEVFGTALSGNCKARPGLPDQPLPLAARISALPCRGGEEVLRKLFEPLGYEVAAEGRLLDEAHPEWGSSEYFSVTLTGKRTVRELLQHLYVLIPVLDAEKHYWVGPDEVEKLLRRGEGWLSEHPERELIARRYLRKKTNLVREALRRLEPEPAVEAEAQESADAEEAQVERPLSLNEQRLAAVTAVLRESGATRVLDLGCGEGRLIRELLKEKQFTEIVGLDVSWRALEIARDRLRLDRMPEAQRGRVRLLHGALTYRDRRLEGCDAAAVVEVIEHLDPPRLAAFERMLFGHARPAVVVLTTPNAEYNVRWPSLPAGRFRHRDHRFEWSRAELREWAEGVGERFGYAVELRPVGPEDPKVGAPTQMSVFRRPR